MLLPKGVHKAEGLSRRAQLISDGRGIKRHHRIGHNGMVVGSHPEAGLPIRSNEVSTVHADVRSYDGHVHLINLDPLGRTWVDHQQVVDPVTLRDGMRIRFGDASYLFRELPLSDDDMGERVSGSSGESTVGRPVRSWPARLAAAMLGSLVGMGLILLGQADYAALLGMSGIAVAHLLSRATARGLIGYFTIGLAVSGEVGWLVPGLGGGESLAALWTIGPDGQARGAKTASNPALVERWNSRTRLAPVKDRIGWIGVVRDGSKRAHRRRPVGALTKIGMAVVGIVMALSGLFGTPNTGSVSAEPMPVSYSTAATAPSVAGTRTAPAQPGVEQGQPNEIMVKDGDELSEFPVASGGLSVQAWAQANGIANPNLIIAGRPLKIPAGWDGKWLLGPGGLWALAERFHVPGVDTPDRVATLIRWNPDLAGKDPHELPATRVWVVDPAQFQPPARNPPPAQNQPPAQTEPNPPTSTAPPAAPITTSPPATINPPSSPLAPWIPPLLLSGAALTVAAILRWRYRRAEGGLFDRVRGVFGGGATPAPDGRVRTGLRVSAVVGVGAGIALTVLGAGPLAALMGLAVTAVSVVVVTRAVLGDVSGRPAWRDARLRLAAAMAGYTLMIYGLSRGAILLAGSTTSLAVVVVTGAVVGAAAVLAWLLRRLRPPPAGDEELDHLGHRVASAVGWHVPDGGRTALVLSSMFGIGFSAGLAIVGSRPLATGLVVGVAVVAMTIAVRVAWWMSRGLGSASLTAWREGWTGWLLIGSVGGLGGVLAGHLAVAVPGSLTAVSRWMAAQPDALWLIVSVIARAVVGLLVFVAVARALWQERERPLWPGKRRSAYAVGSLIGLSFGAGLGVAGVVAGLGSLVGGLSVAVLVGSAFPAVRVASSWRSLRGKRRVGWRGSRKARVAGWVGVVLGAAVAGGSAPWVPGWVAEVIGWAATKDGAGFVVISLIASMVDGALAWRYVRGRRATNRANGLQTQSWRDAWWSAGWSTVVSWVNTVLAFAAIGEVSGWMAVHWGVPEFWSAVVPAMVAAAVGSGLQRRLRCAERGWFAGLAAVYAIPNKWFVALLAISTAPHTWTGYLGVMLLWAVYAQVQTYVGDYLVAWSGRRMALLFKRPQQRARQASLRAAIGMEPAQPRHIRRQRARDHFRVVFETFGRPDPGTTALKLDGFFGTIIKYVILWQAPGGSNGVVAVAGRVIVAAVMLMVTWLGRDQLDQKTERVGYTIPRSMALREHHLGPRRVSNRTGPFRGELDDLLTVTYRVLRSNPDRVLDPTLAKDVVRRLIAALRLGTPEPVELLWVIEQFPELADRAREVMDLWAQQHAQDRPAALALLLLASNREALRGAASRMPGRGDDEQAKVVEFLVLLGDELIKLANLNKLFTYHKHMSEEDRRLIDEDRELLGLPLVGQKLTSQELNERPVILRSVWQQRLHEALLWQKALGIAYLRDAEHELWLDLRGLVAGPGNTDELRYRVDLLIARTQGELRREQGRKIDGRGLVAAQALLGERLRGLQDALTVEHALLDKAQQDLSAPEMSPVRITALEHQVSSRTDRIRTYRRVEVALALLDTSLGILDEIEQHRLERGKWQDNFKKALIPPSAAPRGPPLLMVLLIGAGETTPLTVDSLVARHRGTGWENVSRATWQRRLRDLAAAGLLSGGPRTGYTVTYDELRAEWRAANPRLRQAFQNDPKKLPGREKLGPLLRATINSSGTEEEKQRALAAARLAQEALLDLLILSGEMLFRYHEPGVRDDLVWTSVAWPDLPAPPPLRPGRSRGQTRPARRTKEADRRGGRAARGDRRYPGQDPAAAGGPVPVD